MMREKFARSSRELRRTPPSELRALFAFPDPTRPDKNTTTPKPSVRSVVLVEIHTAREATR
jgi:hypothetical protein